MDPITQTGIATVNTVRSVVGLAGTVVNGVFGILNKGLDVVEGAVQVPGALVSQAAAHIKGGHDAAAEQPAQNEQITQLLQKQLEALNAGDTQTAMAIAQTLAQLQGAAQQNNQHSA